MSDLQTKIGQSFAAQGLMKTIGAHITHVSEGEVHIALPFSTQLSQQHGYVHAGAIASILDSACGYAALTKAPVDHERRHRRVQNQFCYGLRWANDFSQSARCRMPASD
jgi:acyl-coenzyme A thioesterase PaaI-like protein